MADKKLVLKITLPDGTNREVTASGENVMVGSGESATVRVDDRTVSPLHLMLKVDKNNIVTCIDLGSEKGTLLGGSPIRGATPVASGDVLFVGESMLRVS